MSSKSFFFFLLHVLKGLLSQERWAFKSIQPWNISPPFIVIRKQWKNDSFANLSIAPNLSFNLSVQEKKPSTHSLSPIYIVVIHFNIIAMTTKIPSPQVSTFTCWISELCRLAWPMHIVPLLLQDTNAIHTDTYIYLIILLFFFFLLLKVVSFRQSRDW